jgi:RNA polymerase sigma-70 factor (ECF subfamily)
MSEISKPEEQVSAAAVSNPPADAIDWRAWLDAHGRKLLLFARQQTRSEQDAEDVFQEALVRLLRKVNAGEFFGGQDAWMPYLYTSIRRLAIDHGRRTDRHQRREEIAGEEMLEENREEIHPWFHGESTEEDTRTMIEEGLKDLPKKFSEVIVLKIWGGKTFGEIGGILGVSQNTAASRYRYGLERLRRKLAPARAHGDI